MSWSRTLVRIYQSGGNNESSLSTAKSLPLMSANPKVLTKRIWTLFPEQWVRVDGKISAGRKALRHPTSVQRECNPQAKIWKESDEAEWQKQTEVRFWHAQDEASAQKKPSEPTNNESWHRGEISTNRVKWKSRYCTNPKCDNVCWRRTQGKPLNQRPIMMIKCWAQGHLSMMEIGPGCGSRFTLRAICRSRWEKNPPARSQWRPSQTSTSRRPKHLMW